MANRRPRCADRPSRPRDRARGPARPARMNPTPSRISMSLHLYNSLSRQVEAFVPLDPARPTMYVCGPTVYNYVHIGNARGPVVFGVLADLLRRRYGALAYARNITDVDDKINAAAAEQGV